ncbi:MAG: NAD(P)-binding domain-containing protein [Acidobacteriales bacterium]|nr:NAD(P)-binding domain-containing protein [Terriglobales bacterium]
MQTSPRVVVIGGGPSGIVASRYLLGHGFEPTIFETADQLGGQWYSASPNSGVWPEMRTNTSRVLTRFSDLNYGPGVAMYPRNQEVHAYLLAYAAKFDLLRRARLNTRVTSLERETGGLGYRVESVTRDAAPETGHYDYAVIASGRFNKPYIPNVPGLETFSGKAGVTHTFYYKHPEQFRGLRVLVAGCAISALEIASDLAMLGAAKVTTSYRRQRYVLPKIVAGVPLDHVLFNRWSACAEDSLPEEARVAGMKQTLLKIAGSPEQFGALKPHEDVRQAGISMSQHFLALVAEARITVKPWIREIAGERVTFADGSSDHFDALIFGTGYDMNLPYLSKDIRDIIRLDDHGLDFCDFTFHPELEHLAFLGMHDQIGSYLPALELQARWIAYVWAGLAEMPSKDEMREGIARHQTVRALRQKQFLHLMAARFARRIGADVNIADFPELQRVLWFGPLAPASFRLQGPDALPDAAKELVEEAACFGCVPSPELSPEQVAQLNLLKKLRSSSERVSL